jgi:tripartite-type tricarboxylate transporter receptor subunit TctC
MDPLRGARSIVCIVAIALSAAGAFAQSYPTRPVRLVVPFPPGSPSDILGRMVGQHYSRTLRQPVVIDNRPGAAGVVGAETVAKAAPDGYTLLMGGTGALAINPGLRTTMPYDSLRDFAPVSLFARIPFILVVSPSVPAATVKELIAVAKAKPRQLNYASSGPGSPTQLAAELFKSMTGTDMVHVPYKGTGPATLDLISGQTHLMFSGITVLMPHVKSEKLRGIAVAAASRTPLLPQLPTVSESGVPGFTAETWTGVLAPRATPAAIVNRLHQDIVGMVRQPDVKERLLGLGAEPIGNRPEEFQRYIAQEISKWTKVIKAVGIKEE